MKLFLILLTFFLGPLNQSKCQSTQFEKIEYALFDVNSYRTSIKDSAFISLYCSISPAGLVKVNYPGDLRDSPKVYYSTQLSSPDMVKINSIINSKTPIKTHMVKTQLGENSFFAGNYDYYRVTYPDGGVDSICIIALFMSEPLKEVRKLLTNEFYRKKERIKIDQFDIPKDFLYSLKTCYFKSSYLPAIISAPISAPVQKN